MREIEHGTRVHRLQKILRTYVHRRSQGSHSKTTNNNVGHLFRVASLLHSSHAVHGVRSLDCDLRMQFHEATTLSKLRLYAQVLIFVCVCLSKIPTGNMIPTWTYKFFACAICTRNMKRTLHI